MKRLFGTDGIRGAAGVAPLDKATILKVGTALTRVLEAPSGRPRILIGRDTRESGSWIESELARGIQEGGGEPAAGGVITTAGVAFLTRSGGFDAGVMISASHNHFSDNGIKIFSRDGYKLPDDEEAKIEAIVLDGVEPSLAGGAGPDQGAPAAGAGTGRGAGDLSAAYIRQILEAAGGQRLDGLKVVLDCANGAASDAAPAAFEELGATLHVLSARPDGKNINDGCGSLHPGEMSRSVVGLNAHVGFAFDGDADRCILADEKGRVCDGDFIMYRAALAMRDEGRLAGDTVVGTVMSNLWLERALDGQGIRLLRAQVGDKYVLEEMLRTGARLGGEQSGHVIFLDHATTGDGILTAVKMASLIRRAGAPLSEWRDEVKPCPQVLLNTRVSTKPDLETHPAIGPAVASVRNELGSAGRLLLRYSGTEPLARVMIEGEDADRINRLARELADLIRREIGEE